MYTSFRIKNFRCFKDLELKDLARVNLIAGKNNVGKTALLEALFIGLRTHGLLHLIDELNAGRGLYEAWTAVPSAIRGISESPAPWSSLFSRFDTSMPVEVSYLEERGTYVVTLRVVDGKLCAKEANITTGWEEESSILWNGKALVYESPPRGPSYRLESFVDPAFFVPARAHLPFKEETALFSKLRISGLHNIVIDVLKQLEPRLTDLELLDTTGVSMLYGDIGRGRLMPLRVMGDGMIRLANFVLCIGNAEGGIVLIDEVENGFHHSILPEVWKAIGNAARQFGTQVFATTHSYECLVAAHRAFSESKTCDFRLHRLEEVKGEIKAITYDQETLEAAINMGLEVR